MRLPNVPPAVAAAGLLLLLAAAGCGHSEPFETTPPEPLEPPSAGIPRQVTFNPGDDRAPAVQDTVVVFSRRTPDAPFGAPCIAVLPVAGGTLRAEHCPPPPTPADTFVSNWLEPALSPDGSRLAFVWRRSARVSALAAWSHDLVVAPAVSPTAPEVSLPLPRTFPDGRIANTAIELRWVDDHTLRYLAAYEYIFKVKGGGADRFTDTTYLAYALMELDTRIGTALMVPGADSVTAYADDGTGGAWVAWGGTTPAVLMHLAPDGTRAPGPELPFTPTDFTWMDGELVIAGGQTRIAVGDPTTGAWRFVGAAGPVFRFAPGQERTVLAEVERAESEFGMPANLWLIPVPR